MKKYIILTITIIAFSGCSHFIQTTPKKLQKETQELSPIDKRLVYKTIKNDINLYKQLGDENYKNGYNYDAIIAYERVNFYEGDGAIPKYKIQKIKKIAKKNAKYYYKKFKKSKEKTKKLYALNKIMMNNPDYKDAKKLLKEILKDKDIIIFLNQLKNKLYTELKNNHNTTKDLLNIQKAYLSLVKYDYKNQLNKEAKEVLKKNYQPLIDDAKNSYNHNNLNLAKKKFITILKIYKNNKIAKQYILKIDTKQNIKSNIEVAKQALYKKNYTKALKFAKTIIKVEPNNKEAKDIQSKAKKGYDKKISQLINTGIKNYKLGNLDEAQKNFQEVLKLKPNNSTSLLYTKKIQRQLKTIKSLKY